MNLIKRWRKSDQHPEEERSLAKGRADDAYGLGRLRHEMDRAFERMWRDFDRDPWSSLTTVSESWPALDMDEDENGVTLRVEVPGLGPDDVNVAVSGNRLTIHGSREEEKEHKEKHGLRRHERFSGSFMRSVTLPTYIDGDQMEARYDKGVLTLRAPRLPGQGPRRVPVKAS